MAQTFCTKCGHQTGADDQYCRACGQARQQDLRGSQRSTAVVDHGWDWKRWLLVGGGIFITVIIIAAVYAGDSDDGEITSKVLNSKEVTFGTGPNDTTDGLDLLGIASTFDKGTDVWLRMSLPRKFGSSSVKFLLEKGSEKGVWSPVTSWFLDTDPDYSIYRGLRPELNGLATGTYKVFAIIEDEKRAEGQFDIRSEKPATRGTT